MSTDFSIKPVGAPVAAPIAQPLSDAAQNAVATVLPVSRTVTATDASARTGNEADAVQVSLSSAASNAAAATAASASVSSQVVIDRDAAAVVYQVVDNRTSQVVKQFPAEAVLRRRAYFHTLDLTRDAPTRLRATDRSA